MATIAPMLETLGYNPNDTHPNYEKVPFLFFLKVFDLSESESVWSQADPEVLRNNQELTEQAGMWAVSVDLFIYILTRFW